MLEREFAAVPQESKYLLRKAVAEATGQPVEKIGDGKLLELLSKLLPLILQFLPLFMADKEEADRKIGDGTLLTALLAALNNPDFVKNISGLIALIQSLFPAK